MKSLIEFESHQPFAVRFFTQALTHRHMVNAYVFRGRDLATQYRMVLRLAQIMNCSHPISAIEACGQCQSCRWIEENAHPGVITVTNLSYLTHVDPETGASRSKSGKPQQSIIVEQLENLLNELSLHSGGFHRIVILAGAQEMPCNEEISLPFPPPRDWSPQQNGQFQLLPLDRKFFPDRLSNKFLKTLEEPPMDVLFFLLTDSEEKLLDTILSRCQLVPFVTPAAMGQVVLSIQAREYFQQLLQHSHQADFMSQTKVLTDFCSESGLPVNEALVQFQHFLWEQVRQHPLENSRYHNVRRTLRLLEQARRMIEGKTKEETVLEDLFLQMGSR